ncbi:hypothetical protein [Treponema sp. UBA3813]|uniref:hypothetical protein n=1 Tax=Treponema sp. UBA3813 TaxID=1947715 RepID=UPI0025E8AE3C|nr:hypothetical protein [Treponema sp. UBA3813]
MRKRRYVMDETEEKNTCGIKISGQPLDGETQTIITFDMLEKLHTILCYDYEDGKPWHDMTCVMELIFQEIIYKDDKCINSDGVHFSKIRYLYPHPWSLLSDFHDFAENFTFYCPCLTAIRMDLTANYFRHDYKDEGIFFDEFESFNCTIKHKKRYFPKNPVMPDD